MLHDFDTLLSRSGLSTAKWEQEIARLRDPRLLAFGTADMDFRSAPAIVEALVQTAQRGHFGYPFKGPGYYDAITGYFQRRFGWQVQPSWIAGATGVYASWSPIVEQLTATGDEIIFQTPAHHIFRETVAAMGRVPVENPLVVHGGRHVIDLEDLARKITPRTRLVLLCNPHNPTGRVWSRQELSDVQDLCLQRGVTVVTDEIYAGLVHRGQVFTPAACVSPQASHNTITLTSASKAYNITGLKHSLVIAENPRLRAACLEGQRRSNMYYGGSLFGHVATEVALRDCDEWNAQLLAYIESNLDHTARRLQSLLPKARIYAPQSTYFLWVDLSAYAAASGDLIDHFERRLGITVTSGHMMGTGGDRHIRLNLGCPRSQIDQAIARMQATPLA